MADHFVSMNRGIDGFKASDFTTGTSSTAANQIELRVKDGASLSKLDVVKALEAFERFFEDPKLTASAGFDVSG
jgi:hypothetical protein